MKKIKRNGFVLIIVIALIAVIGLEMFVLAGGSNTILFQADTAELRAIQSNLVASGLAWSKRNVRDPRSFLRSKSGGKPIELDVTNMDIRDANLSVVIGATSGEELQVQLSTSCSKSRQTLRSGDKYTIGL